MYALTKKKFSCALQNGAKGILLQSIGTLFIFHSYRFDRGYPSFLLSTVSKSVIPAPYTASDQQFSSSILERIVKETLIDRM
jgi:hypothetical protein